MNKCRILVGDALTRLRDLPTESVHTCVTSPPYWCLRCYGVAGQVGAESTPDEYVARLVSVFAEVRRVLRDDGTLWLNIGDCYTATPNQRKTTDKSGAKQGTNAGSETTGSRCAPGLKPKNLVGIPWRVAFALQADGWYLRSEIIWAKPNCMPESVTDRPTKSHEYIFLLSKSERYAYDAEAIREPDKGTDHSRKIIDGQPSLEPSGGLVGAHKGIRTLEGRNGEGRNKRSVWTVATRPFAGDHFATFPEELIAPCVLAGCVEGGTVLDPFGGAGTTGLVAVKRGRNAVLIELNPRYASMAKARIATACPMFAEVSVEKSE